MYAPINAEEKKRAAGKDPYAPCKGDSDAVAAWRSRMGTEAAKLIYQLRGQTAEWVNAQARNRGFWFMPVRGQPRCRIIALLFATSSAPGCRGETAHSGWLKGRLSDTLQKGVKIGKPVRADHRDIRELTPLGGHDDPAAGQKRAEIVHGQDLAARLQVTAGRRKATISPLGDHFVEIQDHVADHRPGSQLGGFKCRGSGLVSPIVIELIGGFGLMLA